MPDQPTDHQHDQPEEEPYTPEEVRVLLSEAMDEYYSLCPDPPMTPARLDEMVETMRRNARREKGVTGSLRPQADQLPRHPNLDLRR